MESPFDRIEKLAGTQVTKARWALGISGVLSIAVAVVLLAWPGISLFALTMLVGAFAVASGIVRLGIAFTPEAKDRRGWFGFSGVVGIAFGVAVLVWPNISALALLYVIGAYAIAIGIMTIVGAFQLPIDGRDTALMILTGLVAIFFGVVMLARPGAGALALLALIAAFALVMGVCELVLAIGGKRLVEHEFKRAFEPPKPPTKSTPQASH
jgi:uncharacterized membrane protein HdeD (DUF308 family)